MTVQWSFENNACSCPVYLCEWNTTQMSFERLNAMQARGVEFLWYTDPLREM